MAKYRVVSYDVWGNAKDGYEVNDTYPTGLSVELPANPSDREIMQALKEVGYIKKSTRLAQLMIDGEPRFSFYVDEAKDGRPLCELRRVNEQE